MNLKESSTPSKVVVNSDDCIAILDLFKVFNIKGCEAVIDTINDFMVDKTLYNQRKITVELCKLLQISNHPMFEYGMWDNLKESANSTAYDLEFDMDLEDTIKVSS